MATNGSLSTNQRRALDALLTTTTVRAAASKAHLGERTVYRYLRDPAFRSELRDRQTAIMTATTTGIIAKAGKVVDRLEGVLDDPGANNAEIVSAARAWMGWVHRGFDDDVLLARVEALEARLNDKERSKEQD